MKRVRDRRRIDWRAILLAIMALVTPVAATDSAADVIPEGELIQAVAKRFPSWKIVRCAEFAGGLSLFTMAYFARSSHPSELRPREVACRVNGDFDGDGRLDAAVQLGRGDGSSPRTIVVVVFRRPAGLLPVYAGEGDDTLAIATKGTIDRDYAGEGAIRYENDAIYVGHDESAGVSLVFKDGRFLVFTTGD